MLFRSFDDPALLIHTSWTPDVPGVTVNLYKEGTAPDGTVSLTLIDTTKTSSWDDWAQGFRSDGMPNMNCPGQGTNTGTNADLFFFSLFNQPNWLDQYNNGGTAAHTLPKAVMAAARSEVEPATRVGGSPGWPVSAMRPLMPWAMVL